MRSRTDGMWWGTAIEAPDPGALAHFYSELLGWLIGHEEPGTSILAAPQGSPSRHSGLGAGRAALPCSYRGIGRAERILRIPRKPKQLAI
jgi:hypothetical protein